jgi:hypothetical protein
MLASAAAVAFATGCVSPALQQQVEAGEVASSDHWVATIEPMSSSGSAAATNAAPAITGTARIMPDTQLGQTVATVTISNATPGAVYPWFVELGRCGSDLGILGAEQWYSPVTIGPDGTGTATVHLASGTPITGSYFVSVRASPSARGQIVACGNLRQVSAP